MKRTHKIIISLLTASFTAYVGSYFGLSFGGHYEPACYGLARGPDGSTILAPKAAFGYEWHPFTLITKNDRLSFWTYFYIPLIVGDRHVWHTNEKMNTLKYRVKNYFDYETFHYRDINPE